MAEVTTCPLFARRLPMVTHVTLMWPDDSESEWDSVVAVPRIGETVYRDKTPHVVANVTYNADADRRVIWVGVVLEAKPT